MSIGPLLSGRIPVSLFSDQTRGYIQQSSSAMLKLQAQIGSQQKFQLFSDAPSAALRTLELQKLLERKTQSSANVKTSTSLLSASESSLSSIADALNSAKGLTVAGIGNSVSPAEREALAIEANSLIRQVLTTGNTQFRDRFLFGGQSSSQAAPYTMLADGSVRYGGDRESIQSLIDLSTMLDNNITGQAAIGGLSTPLTNDLDPALTMSTRIADLNGGRGLSLGPLVVQLDDGVNNIAATVDLTGASTVQDIKTRLEAAFAGGPITLTVDIDPVSRNQLRLTPASGTVEVLDVAGGLTATNLGLATGPVATISGSDLDPAMSLSTPLSALNNGAGVSLTGGLRIVNGQKVSTVDLTGATKVEDILNKVRLADPDLDVGLNADRTGIAIGTRISGVDFSIGENGGTTATSLGVRTFTGETLLSSLDRGRGVPVEGSLDLEIFRRDGSTTTVDLAGAKTVQDVLDLINTADPGNLVASLVTTGNGIQLTDNSGTGALRIEANLLSSPLGIAGTGAGPGTALVGTDPNPQSAKGSLDVLIRLEKALRSGDNREIERLSGMIETELNSLNQTRGEVGTRLRILDDTQNRLDDELVTIQTNLSDEFDVDYADVITQLSARQFALEALYQITAQTMQMSIVNYL